MDFLSPSKMFFALALLAACLLVGCGGSTNPGPEQASTGDIAILQGWSGDFPVAKLDRLPADQRQSSLGFLGEQAAFAAVWEAFQPGESLPEIDFRRNIVVFTRNVDFYNRTRIVKVTLKGSTAEIVAIETRSALPIEERVAMALAVIPRRGVKFLQVGENKIAVQ